MKLTIKIAIVTTPSGHCKDAGQPESGAYVCERDAMGAGARAAKNEKHP